MPEIDIEVMGQPAPPRLSQETISYEEGLLNNPRWVEANPQHAAMLRRTLDEAKAAIGYRPPPPDGRTAQQRAHDRQFGITYGPAGEVTLPEQLSTLIERDAKGGKAENADAVAKHLARTGRNPETVIADAREALQRTGSKVAVESLSAFSLTQLAIFGQHLRKHGKTRPQ